VTRRVPSRFRGGTPACAPPDAANPRGGDRRAAGPRRRGVRDRLPARAFPGLLGYQWSDARFLAYNLVWIAAFAAAALGLRHDVALASLAAGFCVIGARVANGVGHVALALARWAYFPGLLTAPLCLAAGVVLLRSIWRSDRASV
jgi:uncharacterized protein with HXXEE motif